MASCLAGNRLRFPSGVLRSIVYRAKRSSALPWSRMASRLCVSDYTLRIAWGCERTTLPEAMLPRLLALAGEGEAWLEYRACAESIRAGWGQRKGALLALQSQGIQRVDCIRIPVEKRALLAEFVGILLGDGHLSRKSFTIVLAYPKEREYADFVIRSVVDLFGKKPLVARRNNSIRIVLNSVESISFLNGLGIACGSRCRRRVRIPDFVWGSRLFLARCVRGLIDTDGCVFRKQKQYTRLGIEFKNTNASLLSQFARAMNVLGFNPCRSKYAIRIQRQEEVARYAKEIGFSNPKNLRRYAVARL